MAIESATTATVTNTGPKASRQFGGIFSYVIPNKVAFEEDSIAADKASAAVYTIPGAQLGDFVLVSAVSDLGDDIFFNGQVTAADEVTVIASDASGATNTSAATVGVLYILVLGINDEHFA